MKKILLLILLITIAACSQTAQESMMEDTSDSMEESEGMMEDTSDTMMEDTSDTLEESEGMMEDTDNMMQDTAMGEDMESMYMGESLAGTTTPYLAFNQEDYEQALAKNKIILLNFYAGWCPVCREEQSEAFSAFNNLDNQDVIGFRVNYKDGDTDDYEEMLAEEFGITYQHTKVIIKDGQRVLKAPDSWDENRYIEEINKVA